MKMTIISLVISGISAVAGIVSSILACKFFNSNRKMTFFKIVYDAVSPISVFIYDALLTKDNKHFCNTNEIKIAEQQLYSNFESLNSYGAGHNLFYLEQFSTLKLREAPISSDLQCYLFVLSSVQDEYIKYRTNRVGDKTSKQDLETLQVFVDAFRYALNISAKYTLPILFKRTVTSKNAEQYYNELLKLYNFRKANE